MITSIDLSEVRQYAIDAHAAVRNKDGSMGQRRKYTNEPYISHPLAVAGLVATVPGATTEDIAAAILHDVPEDTAKDRGMTRQEAIGAIEMRFGSGVASKVDWLSDITTPEDGNRRTRKRIECERLARAPASVQTIKIADLLHNSMSIVTNDLDFSVVYLPEKKDLLDNLTLGDVQLRAWAYQLLKASWERVNNQLPVEKRGTMGSRP